MKRRLLAMGWRDALFLHWPVDPATVRERLPTGLEPRVHDGTAWLGVVAFVMEAARPRGLPRAVGRTFGEANLRTYVTGPDGEEGIYFFNLDASDPVGVVLARRCFRLPYYRATMRIDRTVPGRSHAGSSAGRTVDFVSNRIHRGAPHAHLDATYGPLGEAFRAEPGSLEAFLVENYRFYLSSEDVPGRRSSRLRRHHGSERPPDSENSPTYTGDVAHDPWPLYRADLELRSTDFLAINGFDRPDETPLAHYSPGVDVEIDRIRRVE